MHFLILFILMMRCIGILHLRASTMMPSAGLIATHKLRALFHAASFIIARRRAEARHITHAEASSLLSPHFARASILEYNIRKFIINT